MKPLRPRLPSLVELIDHTDPSPRFYEVAELPARPELKVRTPEAGISGRGAASTLRPRFLPYVVLAVVFVAFAYVAWKEFGL